jgi:hypothetical protein
MSRLSRLQKHVCYLPYVSFHSLTEHVILLYLAGIRYFPFVCFHVYHTSPNESRCATTSGSNARRFGPRSLSTGYSPTK